MIYLGLAVLFFGFFFATHVVGYRLKIIKGQPWAFLLISVFWLGIYLMILGPVTEAVENQGMNHDYLTAPLKLTSVGLYLLLCLGYLAECTVVENESPSIRMIKVIRNQPEGKASYERLSKEISNEEFVFSRLMDLVVHGHVSFDGTHYRLNRRGEIIASLIGAYRHLLRRGVGG